MNRAVHIQDPDPGFCTHPGVKKALDPGSGTLPPRALFFCVQSVVEPGEIAAILGSVTHWCCGKGQQQHQQQRRKSSFLAKGAVNFETLSREPLMSNKSYKTKQVFFSVYK